MFRFRFLSSLVLIYRRHTWDTLTAWDTVMPSQALTAGLPAKLNTVQHRRQAGGCRWLSAMKIFYVNII